MKGRSPTSFAATPSAASLIGEKNKSSPAARSIKSIGRSPRLRMSIDPNQLGIPIEKVAVILVDHGSKVDESNRLLEEIVAAYRKHSDWAIVEPAHMELAEPSIAAAFDRCAQPGVEHLVTGPLGLHEMVLKVVDQRISEALGSRPR